GLRIGQRVLGNLHCLWIDTSNLVGGEQIEERNALRVHLDPVWECTRPQGLSQRHGPGFRVELADEVAALDREPERSILRKDWRMGIVRSGVGHFVFGYLACLWIEFRNRPRRVCRVPDVAVAIRNQPVWTVASGKIE